MILGLDLETDAALLGWSILEGVACHIAEVFAAQQAGGIAARHLQFIGGGSRSRLWGEMIATLIGLPLDLPVRREVGASLGAARLARVAVGDGGLEETLCRKPDVEETILPNARLQPLLEERFRRFRRIFSSTRSLL